jgi:hypothetical protein
MKQKKIGDILYIFDSSAYQITADTDADIVYIQQEYIPAYKVLNSSTLNDKIKPYNYKLNIIDKPEWGDYIYADEPVPEKQDLVVNFYDLDNNQISSPWIFDSAIESIAKDAGFNVIDASSNVVECSYTSSNGSVADVTDGSESKAIEAKDFGETTITASWPAGEDYKAGEKQITVKVVPTLHIDGNDINSWSLPGKDTITLQAYGTSAMYDYALNVFGNEITAFTLVSANSDIVSIEEDSEKFSIAANITGNTTLTATWTAGEGYSAGTATWNVTVVDA